jgi:hypothetical protein
MKKILILTTLILLSYNVKAQFFNESVRWNEVKVSSETHQIISHVTYHIKGKTQIDGKTYLNVCVDDDLRYYIHETEDKKIYIYFPSCKHETLLYDFDWQVGGRMHYEMYCTNGKFYFFEITKLSPIKLLNNKDYVCANYGKDFFGNPSMIIKGFGSTNGFFDHIFPKPTCSDYTINLLYELYKDDELVYRYPEDIPLNIKNGEENNQVTVYPQPAKDNITFKFKAEGAEELRIYNSKGILIKTYNINNLSKFKIEELLQTGVYFYTIQYKKSKTLSGKFIIKN